MVRTAPAAPTALRSNDPCWCGSGRKYKRCHKPLEGRVAARATVSPMRTVPADDRPAALRRHRRRRRAGTSRGSSRPRSSSACAAPAPLAAEVLRLAGELVRPGITTDEIDAYVHELHIERGAYPSPLNYNGFPKSVCTSVNEVICHGIPDDRALQDGDIVNLDVTVYLDGVHGDTNATFLVGDVDAGEPRSWCGSPRSACGTASRPCEPGPPAQRHRPGDRGPRQAAPLRRGAGVHRPRHRRAVPHRPAGPALLRPAGHHDHAAGHDVHDRADDHAWARWQHAHVGRRLDRGHRRRQAHGAVRAHDPRHRRRRPTCSPSPTDRTARDLASSPSTSSTSASPRPTRWTAPTRCTPIPTTPLPTSCCAPTRAMPTSSRPGARPDVHDRTRQRGLCARRSTRSRRWWSASTSTS